MGLRVKRYGPLATMVVVGRLVGTFEPAQVIVTMAQATSASARTNTIAPSQLAATSAGRNGKRRSQLSASPIMTARPHATGGHRSARPQRHRFDRGAEPLVIGILPILARIAPARITARWRSPAAADV